MKHKQFRCTEISEGRRVNSSDTYNPLCNSERPKHKQGDTKKQTEKEEKTSFAAYLCGTAEMIIIDLFYGLKVDYTLQLGLMFVCREEKYIVLVKN